MLCPGARGSRWGASTKWSVWGDENVWGRGQEDGLLQVIDTCPCDTVTLGRMGPRTGGAVLSGRSSAVKSSRQTPQIRYQSPRPKLATEQARTFRLRRADGIRTLPVMGEAPSSPIKPRHSPQRP